MYITLTIASLITLTTFKTRQKRKYKQTHNNIKTRIRRKDADILMTDLRKTQKKKTKYYDYTF